MTEKQLRKEFTEKWNKENQTKYIVWLICSVAEWIPVAIVAVQGIGGGINEQNVGTIFIGFAAYLVLAIIAAVISMGQKKEWKAYREANKHRIQ